MDSTKALVDSIRNTDWEFSKADTQYLTHNIHRYSGKFIPQIAGTAIQLMTGPGETVFDPYLGSGTTALEAMLSGRRCIGVDLNPLAILISNVKTTIIDIQTLQIFQQDLLASIDFVLDSQVPLLTPRYQGTFQSFEQDARYNNPWNRKWYQDHVLRQLIRIYDIVDSIGNQQLRQVAQVSFSDILRRSSNANSRYPNVMYDKNMKVKPLPLRAFRESFNENIARLISLANVFHGRPCPVCKISQENNTSLSLKPCSVDAIVTHPPYIAAIPYAEYGCLSLEWLGYSSKQLDAELTGGKRQRKDVVNRFLHDYELMFAESYRVLRPGGFAFYMVGNPTVNGTAVNLYEKTIEYAIAQGFRYLYTASRHGSNRRGNQMGAEYLVFFQKE